MEKVQNHVIYAVTRNGGNPNSDGEDVLLDIYMTMYPETEGEDVSILSGPSLNDPVALAAMLKAGDSCDMVVVVLPDELVPCRTATDRRAGKPWHSRSGKAERRRDISALRQGCRINVI